MAATDFKKVTTCLRIVFQLALVLCHSNIFGQNNLIDSSSWVEGQPTDNIAGFKQIGAMVYNENIIESALNPFNQPADVWKVAPHDPGTYRGMETDPNFGNAQININSDYRFSVWVQLINGNGGKLIALLRGTTSTDFLDASGNAAKDSYFNWAGTFATGGWYLMVGYVKGINSSNDYEDKRGFYNQQGEKVSSLSGPAPYSFNTTTPSFSIVCQLNNLGGTGENMRFFDPRFEEINGNQPSIEELASGFGSPNGTGVWVANSSGIHFNSGNVGIGTSTPDAPLSVNGRIHSKEVKVDMLGWPDYVFSEDYHLPTLEEIEKHIQEKGHLINIPSAAEVEANGIELGEMNKLLLEKIEELTLYLLDEHRKNKQQEIQLDLLRKEINRLKFIRH